MSTVYNLLYEEARGSFLMAATWHLTVATVRIKYILKDDLLEMQSLSSGHHIRSAEPHSAAL